VTYQPHPAKLEYERKLLSDPRIQEAIEELTGVIRDRYPGATFEVGMAMDSSGVQVLVTVDVEDTDEVEVLFRSQLLDMQSREGLLLDVITVPPIERTREMLQQRREAAAARS